MEGMEGMERMEGMKGMLARREPEICPEDPSIIKGMYVFGFRRLVAEHKASYWSCWSQAGKYAIYEGI
jgi:hypothetical protein